MENEEVGDTGEDYVTAGARATRRMASVEFGPTAKFYLTNVARIEDQSAYQAHVHESWESAGH